MKVQYFLHNNLSQYELERVKGFPKPAADAELLVVVGGDGAFLKACHGKLPESKKVLLVKKENSTGFYKAADLKDIDDKFWDRLEKEDYKTARLPMLEVEVSSDGKKETHYAVNDVSVRGTTNNRVYEFEIIPEQGKPVKIKADGVVGSTSQGSPAYNKSAFGKVIDRPDSYVVTSALAYTGRYSEVFDGKEETKIVAKGRMQLAIDGSNPFMDELERVELKIKLSGKYVELVTFDDFSVLERAKSLIP